MSSKADLAHEKPDVVDEHQPNVKKVRLAVEAVTVVDKKASDSPDAAAGDASNDEDTSAEESPKDDEADGDVSSAKDEGFESTDEAPSAVSTPNTTPNTTGSAFGGFAAFSSSSGFAAFAAKPAAATSGGGGFGAFASSAGSAGGGFASFQTADSASFSSFGAPSDASESSGFGTTASAAASVEFGSNEVKKPESTFVPALTDAEIANGEEGERILIEKRAKLFKLGDKEFAEVGIGPLRVLRLATESAASARLVMRRESYPRGPGTKLLLNARLNACLACIEKTDKAMLLTVVESAAANASEEQAEEAGDAPPADANTAADQGEPHAGATGEVQIKPSTYLIRFGSSEDFQSVLSRLRPWLPSTTTSS
ncbi:hypothetical protein PybrP1_013077 [[Pythium] brassicae (nom. inval.)]|nr:hypothetical protein PybrP1_013077 [[Pythium] brassicae (nom. inval.)]